MHRLWLRTRWSTLAEEEEYAETEAVGACSEIGTIIKTKSKLGVQPKSVGEGCYGVWQGGDFINNDELQGSQPFCQMNECIPEVVQAMRECVKEVGSCRPFSANNTADDPNEMIGKDVLDDKFDKHVNEEPGEDEELHSQRSKLFRPRDGAWKELGIGEAKLLQHRAPHCVRFTLRQEKTGNVVANHYVVDAPPYCNLQPNAGNDRAWVWSAPDFAAEEVETNCIFAL
eukprot:266933-Alexandrium_andersonii.AAC.1